MPDPLHNPGWTTIVSCAWTQSHRRKQRNAASARGDDKFTNLHPANRLGKRAVGAEGRKTVQSCHVYVLPRKTAWNRSAPENRESS